MAIDVGDEAIERSTSIGHYTLVSKGNPANASGTITTVEIQCQSNLINCEVAIFYVVSGNNLSTRSNVSLGTVTSGSKQTFPGLSLSVETGDYIGVYYTSGFIEWNSTGGLGLWYVSATDKIPCTNQAFSFTSDDIFSLKGTGVEVGAGWSSGDVLGVDIATVSKINGVALADITKVNGVA